MFNVGDVVKYGVNGICRITDIVIRDFCGTDMEYYVLKPTSRDDSTYFVPTGSEVLTAKMQYILSKEEALKLIGELPEVGEPWIANDKQRAEAYGQILSSKDRRKLFGVVRTLYTKKAEIEKAGKKMHVADERIMNDAERIIGDELSVVLGIKRSEVPEFIDGILQGK